jgi:hypothetical protein
VLDSYVVLNSGAVLDSEEVLDGGAVWYRTAYDIGGG